MIDANNKVFHPRSCFPLFSRLLPRGADARGTPAKARLLGERLDQETFASSRTEISGGAEESGERVRHGLQRGHFSK